MEPKAKKKLESDYRNARDRLIVAAVMGLVILVVALLFPSISPYSWIALGANAFGLLGWLITMISAKRKLSSS